MHPHTINQPCRLQLEAGIFFQGVGIGIDDLQPFIYDSADPNWISDDSPKLYWCLLPIGLKTKATTLFKILLPKVKTALFTTRILSFEYTIGEFWGSPNSRESIFLDIPVCCRGQFKIKLKRWIILWQTTTRVSCFFSFLVLTTIYVLNHRIIQTNPSSWFPSWCKKTWWHRSTTVPRLQSRFKERGPGGTLWHIGRGQNKHLSDVGKFDAAWFRQNCIGRCRPFWFGQKYSASAEEPGFRNGFWKLRSFTKH